MTIINNAILGGVVIIAASLPLTACFSEDTAPEAKTVEASETSADSVSQALTSNEVEYISVKSTGMAYCSDLTQPFYCVESRNDKQLSILARAGRMSLEEICKKNDIKEPECRPGGIVRKHTLLKASARSQ